MADMYARKEGGFWILRQERFRAQLSEGKEHPHDVCAIAHSRDELRKMIAKSWPDATYEGKPL